MQNQSLEYIVITHFPLIEDKFNFRLGTVKGISFGYNIAGYSTKISIYSPVSLTPKIITYTTKEKALENYRKIVTEYFSEYVNNNHLDLLYNELISVIIPKIDAALENRKNDINKLCKFTHARFKIIDKHEYVRLFKSSNELCRISYASTDISKRKPRYVSIKRNKRNDLNVAVTKADIPLIMEDIETNLIINDNQRKMIIEQLNLLASPTNGYDTYTENITPPNQSRTITLRDLETIKKGLEVALELQTRKVVDNSLTKEKKWERYCLYPDTYSAWLIVTNAIQNKHFIEERWKRWGFNSTYKTWVAVTKLENQQ